MIESNNTNQVNTKKKSKRIFFIVGIALILLSIATTLLLTRGCHNNDALPNGDNNNKTNEFKAALRHIANEEYRNYASVSSSNKRDFIKYVSSYGFNNDKFVFVAKTNLGLGDKYILISLKGTTLTSVDTSLNYLKDNYNNLSNIDKEVSFYNERTERVDSLDLIVNEHVNGGEIKHYDKFVGTNPNLIFYSVSSMKDNELSTLIGEHDLSVFPYQTIENSYVNNKISGDNADFINIVE